MEWVVKGCVPERTSRTGRAIGKQSFTFISILNYLRTNDLSEQEINDLKEHLSFLKHEADKFIDGVKESLSGMTKSGKLETLAEMQRETRERLLFNRTCDQVLTQ